MDVLNVADALPAGAYVYLSAQVRDGSNQGGDGVDWHPSVNEVVATVGSDIPGVGSAGITSIAFYLSPQLVLNGEYSLLGDVSPHAADQPQRKWTANPLQCFHCPNCQFLRSDPIDRTA